MSSDTTHSRVAELRGPRQLSDPTAMRAVAHPIRLALLEALSQREPMTATEAGEVIGESATTCSFHLRTLAKYGFVEEADPVPGRRRPWRRTHNGFTFPAAHADAETSLAAGALSELVWGRLLDRARAVLASRPRLSAEAQAITSAAETVAWVTPAEAERLIADLWSVLVRHSDRAEDPSRRPADSVPLELLLFSYPLRAAPPGA